MEILGFQLPGWIGGVAVFLALIVGVQMLELDQKREERRDRAFDPPSSRQLRWHIQHIRRDLRIAVLLLGLILISIWIRD